MSVFTRVIVLHLFMNIIVITVFYSCFDYHCNIAFVSLNRGTATKAIFFLYSFHDIAALIFFVKIVWTSSGLFPFIYTNDLCIFYITVGIATALGYGCTAWYPNLTQIKQGAISYKSIVTMDYLLISQKSSQYFKVFNFKCTSDKQPAD